VRWVYGWEQLGQNRDMYEEHDDFIQIKLAGVKNYEWIEQSGRFNG
jgi:hypothetical protein